MGVFSNFKSIDLIPSLKQDVNGKILQRSARELSQELVSQAIRKPVLTDNWDLTIEYPQASFVEIAKTLVKGVGTAFNDPVSGVSSIINSRGLSQLAKASVGNLTNFLTTGSELVKQLQDRVALMNLSVRTTNVSLPKISIKNEYVKFGPLRYHHTVDYDYGDGGNPGFSMTVIEDEEFPLYPIFETMLNQQIDLETGTINEPAKSQTNIILTMYSDYTGFPFLTYYIGGCHLNGISIGGSGGKQTLSRDSKEVDILKYTLDFNIDKLKIIFSKLNPMVSLASRAVPINQFLSKMNMSIK